MMNYKNRYITSAALLLISSVIVKAIGAVYKIPLTAYVGAVGRGYFATAYNVYLPFHAVIMGAFPIALSKLVSQYNASGDASLVSAAKRGSLRLFSKVGIAGTLIIAALAKPYSELIASSPKSIYTILVLAPSIFFSALAASYRGFYEGFMNMRPTSVSQTLEALFKMIFGLIFARVSMAYLLEVYRTTGCVLGEAVTSKEHALSLIYPVTSAAAMLGVTLGSAVSLLYVFIYYHINKGSLPKAGRAQSRLVQSELLSLSFPIMMSAAVQSVFQFIDTATVQYALSGVDAEVLKTAYSECVSISKTQNGDLSTYVYGLFSASLDFKNLLPGITMALGVCAVPAVSGAYEAKNGEQLSKLINEIYKYTVLLSALGGIALAFCSREVLDLFYKKASPDIPIGCDGLVKYFALTGVLYCVASTAVFCVQAIGRANKSIAPYIVSGIIRAFLNIILVGDKNFLLFGGVISGAVGYFVMCVWNLLIVRKYSKTKFDFKNVLLKPMIISVLTFVFSTKVYNLIDFGQNQLNNLLIKSSICGVLFCMLCFLTGMLKIRQNFCIKKCPKHLQLKEK
ncbi:MAG: oligosaccharide flippase family protein [Eubacterium sp.]|nr:oligosaccharide flippase family protein [Eubacterium sp.]